ncbi:carboxymuconolactone decarboxylase [Clostridium sp.]|uniref:carboxymuconolactone decarboxylase n=1 Tax=Clostridium sp. TaxID=1506 RepID=UPI00262EEC6B|nr:carboxymuconolactone decarboxylase [Clostridium sp.]
MELNIYTIIATIINFTLLFVIIIVLYKGIKSIKNFINRNKELDKKVDIISRKLDEKDNN